MTKPNVRKQSEHASQSRMPKSPESAPETEQPTNHQRNGGTKAIMCSPVIICIKIYAKV